MLRRILEIIKVLIKILMVVVVVAIDLMVMVCTFFAQPNHPELGEFGFCTFLLINVFTSTFIAKKSRVLWLVNILVVTVYIMLYSHVRTLWQMP